MSHAARTERLATLDTAARHYRAQADLWDQRHEPELAERFGGLALEMEKTARMVERTELFS